MQLTLLPGVELVLAIRDPTSECPFGEYELLGPDAKIGMLHKIMEFDRKDEDVTRSLVTTSTPREQGDAHAPAEENEVKEAAPLAADIADAKAIKGMLSPRAPVTLPMECRKAAGIPLEASTFCFAYPADRMEEPLEKLNLTDEPWGYFLLVGGFCFFDEHGVLLACSALTLVPTPWTMNFVGPAQPSKSALKELHKLKRMCTVTLDALQNAGFAAFGWAHAEAHELEHGVPIIESDGDGGQSVTYPHGGFVYEMTGNEQNFFALVPHSAEQLAEFELQFKPEVEPHYKYGIIERYYRQYRRNLAQARKEVEEMTKLTRSATGIEDREESVESKRRRLVLWLKTEIKRFLPITAILLLTSLLIWIAFVDRTLFELCSTFVYYFCLTFSSWVPYRDTAAVAILSRSRSRKRRMYALLTFMPCASALLSLASSLAFADNSRTNADIAFDVFFHFQVYLVIPLMLFRLRLSTAKDMLEGRHGSNKNRDVLIANKVAAAVFDAGDHTGEGADSAALAAAAAKKAVAAEQRAAEEAAAERDKAPASAPEASVKALMEATRDVGKFAGGFVVSPMGTLRGSAKIAPHGSGSVDEEHLGQMQRELASSLGNSKGTPRKNHSLVGPKQKTKVLRDHSKSHLLSGRNMDLAAVQPGGKQRRAAQKLQARLRGKLARRQYLNEIKRRRTDLMTFHWPIFLWTLFDIVGERVLNEMVDFGLIDNFWSSFPVTSIPSWLMFFKDLAKDRSPKKIRFSLSHCIFLIAGLYRLAFRAARFDSYTLEKIETGLEFLDATYGYSYHSYAPTICMVAHFAIFILVTVMGKLSLQLVSTKNACAHLLFPFQFVSGHARTASFSLSSVATQGVIIPVPSSSHRPHGWPRGWPRAPTALCPCPHSRGPLDLPPNLPLSPSTSSPASSQFDFIFLYVFFSLRDVSQNITSIWILQQILLQGNILLRNSGTMDALLNRQLGRLIDRMIFGQNIKGYDPDDDPLFRLQFLARITVQYDLADITALIAVPSVVTFFILRDGWFTLEGSAIIVRHCDLWRLWQRFIVLLVMKPFFSWIAKGILRRTMRKTLLGQRTIHGRSMLAAKLKVDMAIMGDQAREGETRGQKTAQPKPSFTSPRRRVSLLSRKPRSIVPSARQANRSCTSSST